MTETRTALRICPFCEATCGMTLTIDDTLGKVTGARGDHADVFSEGFICPKGASFGELDGDPDRLSAPLVRRNGELTEVSWDEAFAAVADGLGAVLREHGGTSVAVYLGNPNAHTIAGALYAPLIIRGLGTQQVYSASTLDQMPKHVALGNLFGNPLAFTVPDLDRTDHLVDHRCQSAGVQRQPRHRGQLPRQVEGATQTRRPAHRHRPGPHPHRRTGRPAHRTPARHRRRAAPGPRRRALRRGTGRPG